MEDISDSIKKVLTLLQGAYICIDGLDELMPQTRRTILMCLAAQDFGDVKVFLTGRPEVQGEVRRIFENFSPEGCQETVVDFLSDMNDIRRFLKDRIARHPIMTELDKGIREEIVHSIATRAAGVWGPVRWGNEPGREAGDHSLSKMSC